MAADKFQVITKASSLTDEVIVGVSNGKDSIVSLDLSFRYFKKVNAFFMYMIKGLSFQERYLSYLENRYQIEIKRIPHYQLSSMYKYGSYCNNTQNMQQMPTVKIAEIETYIKRHFNCEWLLYGHRANESLERNAMLKKCNGIDEKAKRIYPLTFWSTKNCFYYMKLNRIPLAPDYLYFKRSFGCLWEDNITKIHKHFYQDYLKIKEVFPYVEAVIKRKQFREDQKNSGF